MGLRSCRSVEQSQCAAVPDKRFALFLGSRKKLNTMFKSVPVSDHGTNGQRTAIRQNDLDLAALPNLQLCGQKQRQTAYADVVSHTGKLCRLAIPLHGNSSPELYFKTLMPAFGLFF